MTALLGCLPLDAAADQMMSLASGPFHDGSPGHAGQGTAILAEAGDGSLALVLKDFSTTPGPDLKVWLVKAAEITDAGDVTGSETLSLGALQSPSGDQTYAIPAGVAAGDYGSVAIWCESFAVLFAAASLTPGA